MINDSNDSFNLCLRPAPIFNNDAQSFSTKKERRTPKFVPPPKPNVKSCPSTRFHLFKSRIAQKELPLPVSFKNCADTEFIVRSSVYQHEKDETYFEQCYEVQDKLGVGSFGEVYRVKSKEDGHVYACKRALMRFRGDSDRRRRMAEVAKHEKLPKHHNCIEFYCAWEERQRLYILTEACEKSLATVADAATDGLPEAMLWLYALDLLQAINHLHRNSLVHMDIKPENIFITKDGVCKLGDFGLMFDMSGDNASDIIEGDPKYMAPECLSSQFGPPADLFSLGLSLLELALDLDLPTQGPTWHSLRNGKLPDSAIKLSLALRELLSGLLDPDPCRRLTASQALALPALATFRQRDTLAVTLNNGLCTVAGLLMTLLSTTAQWVSSVTRRLQHTTMLLARLLRLRPAPPPPRDTVITPSSRGPVPKCWQGSSPDGEQSFALPLEPRAMCTSPVLDVADTSTSPHTPFNSTPLHHAFRRARPPQYSDVEDTYQGDVNAVGRPLPQFAERTSGACNALLVPGSYTSATATPLTSGTSFTELQRSGDSSINLSFSKLPSRNITRLSNTNINSRLFNNGDNHFTATAGNNHSQSGNISDVASMTTWNSRCVNSTSWTVTNESNTSVNLPRLREPHFNISHPANSSSFAAPSTLQSTRLPMLRREGPLLSLPAGTPIPRRLFKEANTEPKIVKSKTVTKILRDPEPCLERSRLACTLNRSDGEEEEEEDDDEVLRMTSFPSRNLMELFDAAVCSDED